MRSPNVDAQTAMRSLTRSRIAARPTDRRQMSRPPELERNLDPMQCLHGVKCISLCLAERDDRLPGRPSNRGYGGSKWSTLRRPGYPRKPVPSALGGLGAHKGRSLRRVTESHLLSAKDRTNMRHERAIP
jgi:hypothetical protein